jgi:hypothetical protein
MSQPLNSSPPDLQGQVRAVEARIQTARVSQAQAEGRRQQALAAAEEARAALASEFPDFTSPLEAQTYLAVLESAVAAEVAKVERELAVVESGN